MAAMPASTAAVTARADASSQTAVTSVSVESRSSSGRTAATASAAVSRCSARSRASDSRIPCSASTPRSYPCRGTGTPGISSRQRLPCSRTIRASEAATAAAVSRVVSTPSPTSEPRRASRTRVRSTETSCSYSTTARRPMRAEERQCTRRSGSPG